MCVENVRVHSQNWAGETRGRHRRDRVVGEDSATGFRPAGIVENGPALLADRREQPVPRRRIPGLAGRCEGTQRREILLWRGVAHGGANAARRSRRHPKNGDAVAFDNPPQTGRVGVVGQALYPNDRGAELERAEDHQRAEHPTHICDPAQPVVRLDVEAIAEVDPCLDEKSGMTVHDPLGRARRTRGIDDHHGIIRVAGFCRNRCCADAEIGPCEIRASASRKGRHRGGS